jgi:hypothetical protein
MLYLPLTGIEMNGRILEQTLLTVSNIRYSGGVHGLFFLNRVGSLVVTALFNKTARIWNLFEACCSFVLKVDEDEARVSGLCAACSSSVGI